MGKLVRIGLSFVALAYATAFFAMLFEPFHQRLLTRFQIDSAAWVGPMLTAFASEWFQITGTLFIGAAIGAWLHWAATKFDATHKSLSPKYSIKCVTEGEAKRWYVVLHNDGSDATFGAILDLQEFHEWQGAPVGTVHATWHMNQEATPWRNISKGEAAPMPIYTAGPQQCVTFYQNGQFGLALNDAGQPRRHGTIRASFISQERPDWRKTMILHVDEGRLAVISSELRQHQ